jgi:hypothetical protein
MFLLGYELRFQIMLVTFSVIRVIQVFSPLLGNDLKVTAEEIEIGLVKPNASLANLHIQILKVSFRSCFQYLCFVSFKLLIDFIEIQMLAFCGLRFKCNVYVAKMKYFYVYKEF